MNTGLILEPLSPDDFVLGSDRSLETKFGRAPLNPSSDWSQWLPPYEPQAPVYETNACTSYGTLNALEVLKRFLFKREPDFSDRMLAKGSGTDARRGNTPKAVSEYLRKNWVAFEHEWPSFSAKSVEEFYSDLPQDLKTLAVGRGAEWSFGYQWVSTSTPSLREALKYSPLGISVPAWWKDDNGQYYRPEGVQDGHWVCAFGITDKGELKVLDTYEPYIKTMRADFLPQVAYSYYLSRQVQDEKSWVQFLVNLVLSFWKPETVPPTPPPAPSKAELIVAEANKWLGKDPTPDDKIRDEVACVSSLCKVIQPVIDMGEHTYTPLFKADLDRDPRWKRVLTVSPGCVVVYPTRGQNIGHALLALTDTKLASNNSFGGVKGIWTQNYSLAFARKYFVEDKGLQEFIYQPV